MELIDNFVPDFTNILLGKKNVLGGTYNCVLSETNINISASPMISLMIAYYLKNNVSVFLIAGQESLIHYSSICKKMSFNLTNSENFYFYDAFYSPFRHIIKEELPLSENVPYTFGTSRSKNYYEGNEITNGTFSISDIIETINKSLRYNYRIKFKTERKVIIFDNLSTLPYDKDIVRDEINKIVKLSIDNVRVLSLK
jgi:hypothetical protein